MFIFFELTRISQKKKIPCIVSTSYIIKNENDISFRDYSYKTTERASLLGPIIYKILR